MKFFEENKLWEAPPPWVPDAIQLGYKWKKRSTNNRKITLISMPCDTSTAALIAIGAVRSDLENPLSNNTDGYFDQLVEAYMSFSKDRNYAHSNKWDIRYTPTGSMWSFESYNDEKEEITVRDSKYRAIVKINGKKTNNRTKPCTSIIFRDNALNWQLKDQPIPKVIHDTLPLDKEAYDELGIFEGSIFDENLASSFNGLEFVISSIAKDSKCLQKLYNSGFIVSGDSYTLANLLTIEGDKKNRISRLRALSKNKLPDKSNCNYVITDGISTFLEAYAAFPSSNIIAVCNRLGSVQANEDLRDWLSEQSRYYETIYNDSIIPPSLPASIVIRTLCKKNDA